jgi:serine/threonine protein kinase
LLWRQQGENYLSLPGEILKQLSENNELFLDQSWQLSLTNKESTLLPETFSLGFQGNVFTAGDAYNVDQFNHVIKNQNYIETGSLTSVSQFIKQSIETSTTESLSRQYKVIIISDENSNVYAHEWLKPLLIKLAHGDYLSQNILTILLGWVLVAIGLVLVFLIRHLPLKQQLTGIMSYLLVLFILQYFKFNQQQWFEVFPIILFVSGSWLILLAYQKEYNLISSILNGPPEHLKSSLIPTVVTPNKAVISKNKQSYKSPQNFSPTTKIIVKPESIPTEDLEKTLVLVENSVKNKTSINHHLTVDHFGRYEVEGILGKGAMGIVYQGVDPKINRHVAIKTLQLSDDVDSAEFTEAKERFFREAQTAGGLSHANIVTIYDVGEENKLGYIAMDLLTGAPLSLFTQPGQTLPVPLVYKLLMQITDALDYAHNQNVVHRDIKPANIIYDDDLLKVTVTDFGIAYVSDNSKTRTGIIMGSPYYMSPEQILGLQVDGRSDIFSLGVTFYQLLCGHLPFEGESIASVAYQITKAKAVAVNLHNTKLPASALRITNKAMHKDIEKRYQTMAEFKLALANALKRDFKINVS